MIALSDDPARAEAQAIAHIGDIGANAFGVIVGTDGRSSWEVATISRHGHGPVEIRRAGAR